MLTNFEEVYAVYFDDVYRYLLSLSGSESTAEELTSETFFRAMDALDRFRGECSVRVWLCQIAKNLYYSQLRREKCLAPLEDCRIAEESHEEELEDHSEAARIQELLHALREPYKEVFMWRVYGEKSFRDIGRALRQDGKLGMRDVSPRQAHDPRGIGGRLKWTKLAASCRTFCRSMRKTCCARRRRNLWTGI